MAVECVGVIVCFIHRRAVPAGIQPAYVPACVAVVPKTSAPGTAKPKTGVSRPATVLEIPPKCLRIRRSYGLLFRGRCNWEGIRLPGRNMIRKQVVRARGEDRGHLWSRLVEMVARE